MKSDERESAWRGRIGRWRASGLSGPKFCAREGLYLKSFYTWRKRLAGDRVEQSKGRDLVPVRLIETARRGEVRIEIGSAAIVVTEQSSPTALRTALSGFGLVR